MNLPVTWWRWPPIRPAQLLTWSLVLWFAVKLVFVHVVMPTRVAGRDATAKGPLIASLVPFGDVLYLFRLKDEGIMFYYGRPVLRLASPLDLPATDRPLYCIVTLEEWKHWPSPRRAEVVQHLTDEQGAPLVLVRVQPTRLAHEHRRDNADRHHRDVGEPNHRPDQERAGGGVSQRLGPR